MKLLFTAAAAIVLLGTSAMAQEYPTMSHDSFQVRMSPASCTDIAQRSMERLGFRLGNSGAGWAYGHFGRHHALVQCVRVEREDLAVSVVVASNDHDSDAQRLRRDLVDTMKRYLEWRR